MNTITRDDIYCLYERRLTVFVTVIASNVLHFCIFWSAFWSFDTFFTASEAPNLVIPLVFMTLCCQVSFRAMLGVTYIDDFNWLSGEDHLVRELGVFLIPLFFLVAGIILFLVGVTLYHFGLF